MWPNFTYNVNNYGNQYTQYQQYPQYPQQPQQNPFNYGFNTFISDTYGLIGKYHTPLYNQPLSQLFGMDLNTINQGISQQFGFGQPQDVYQLAFANPFQYHIPQNFLPFDLTDPYQQNAL